MNKTCMNKGTECEYMWVSLKNRSYNGGTVGSGQMQNKGEQEHEALRRHSVRNVGDTGQLGHRVNEGGDKQN
jgi:hypothetical protein